MKSIFCLFISLMLSCHMLAQHQSFESTKDSLSNILQQSLRTSEDSITHLYAWNQMGIAYYQQNKIQEAIKYTERAIEIWKHRNDKYQARYSNIFINQALYYRQIKGFQSAIKMDSIAVLLKHSLGEDNPEYALSLNNLGVDYQAAWNYTQAIECYKKALPYMDENNIPIGLRNLCYCYREIGQYSEAFQLDSLNVAVRSKFGEDNPDYALALNDLGVDYCYLENHSKAIECFEKALPYLDPNNYSSCLQNLSNTYEEIGNIEKALQYAEKALSNERKTGKVSPITLSNIALLYSNNGNHQKAIELGEESIQSITNQYDVKTENYGTLLNNLALIKSTAGNYQEALKLYSQSADIALKTVGEKHEDYVTRLNNIAHIHLTTGNLSEAFSYLTKAEKIQKEINPQSTLYVTILNNIGIYYCKIDNLEKAIEIATKVLDLQKKITGGIHPDYALRLNNLANYYSLIGDKGKASNLTKEAMSIQSETYGKSTIRYATYLQNLAEYEWTQNPITAVQHITESIDIIDKCIGRKNENYINAFYKLINFSNRIKNDTTVIKGGVFLCKLAKEVIGVKNSIYAGTLDLMATSSLRLKKYKDAYALDSMAVFLQKYLNGTKHSGYIDAIHNLAFICHKTQRKELSDRYRQKYLFELTDYIRHNFSYLTNAEREKWWDEKSHLVVSFPYYAYMDHDSLSCALAYNAALLSNGILLNANIEFDNLIKQEANHELLSKYNEVKSLRITLDKAYQTPLNKRIFSIDSLEQVIYQSEKELLKQSKALGDFTKNMALSWKDIQNQLSPNDIAIEFSGFSADSLGVQYIALLLRKDWKCPRIIRLFEQKELDEIDKNEYYTSGHLYQLIWKPIEKELKGIDNIYFTPIGNLHQIAIEYLPLTDGTNIANKYNLYRLSSTRELTKKGGSKYAVSNAVLYGGLEYEIGQTDWAQIKKMNDNLGNLQAFRDIPSLDSLNIRNGLNYLEGTEIEIENIQQELHKLNIPITTFTSINGTEGSFKRLSGQKTNLLHIATHGFYQSEKGNKANQSFASVSDLENTQLSQEDISLSRSGLFFSGAASVLKGESIPKNLDDGILTAKELSRLNLQGLELVVLSACQTGLGDITNEGVFGLQRGFKKAGAQTIIMSLWKVNDEATQVLMTEFYKNLVSGKNKRQSFLDAQEYLRTFNNSKFDKPEYWAAFIMLDAIN